MVTKRTNSGQPPTKKPKTGPADTKNYNAAKAKPKTTAKPTPTTSKSTASKSAPENPLDIGEIRNIIYKDLLRAMKTDGKLNVTLVTLDHTTDTVTKQESDPEKYTYLNVVPKSGHSKLFKLGLASLPTQFKEFLSETAPSTLFSFEEPTSLDNFAEMLSIYLMPEPEIQVPLTVMIDIFRDGDSFRSMTGWKEIEMAHGYSEKAHRQFKLWMEAVQKLPPNVTVMIFLRYPWHDYRSLRGVTANVREKGYGLQVAVQAHNWGFIPSREQDYHLGMTVASITGVEMLRQSNIGREEAAEMLKHGCRGFRSRSEDV